ASSSLARSRPSARSARSRMASRPCLRTASAVRWAPRASRWWCTPTSKPSAASRRAMAAPMPLLAPVTMADGMLPESQGTGGRVKTRQEAHESAAIQQRQAGLGAALEDVAHEHRVADERADGGAEGGQAMPARLGELQGGDDEHRRHHEVAEAHEHRL